MVGFGGWSMPVHYPSGILAEHRAVRSAAGVFDISHMGQFIVSGPGAKAWLNTLFTNNLDRIGANQSQYGFLLNETGGVIDDLIIYEYSEGEFLLVVNASKIDEDFAWLQAHLPAGNRIEQPQRPFRGRGAAGSPRAGDLRGFFRSRRADARTLRGLRARPRRADFRRRADRLYRRGRFRVVFPGPRLGADLGRVAGERRAFWPAPVRSGFARQPCVWKCVIRSMARICRRRARPWPPAWGSSWIWRSRILSGRDALVRQKSEGGPAEKLVAFRMTDKGPPPRSHYPVYSKVGAASADGSGGAVDGKPIGETTSGNLSPTLEAGIGMVYVPAAIARPGETLEIEIRGKRYGAVIEKKPLYKRRDDRLIKPASEAALNLPIFPRLRHRPAYERAR